MGLTRRQIEAFHWAPDAPRFTAGFEAIEAREHLARVSELRRQIREADEAASDRTLRHLWDEAQFEVDKVRLLGDLAIAAYFDGEKPKEREAKRNAFADAVVKGEAERWRDWLAERRHADPPLAPFHWEIEFPEVFSRENPGFDAFVGNPPFMGGRNISGSQGAAYSDWLFESHGETSGGADLVAHFFRSAFDMLRQAGAFGLIATNTIAQGDTRASGLRWICQHGGEIFHVRKRVKWPGMAAVVVSVVHMMRGHFDGVKHIDDRAVETINAFLFHRGGHDDPKRLAANTAKSFQGSIILGMGFTFDDTDTKGVATPIAEMERILAAHPDYSEVIFPYIGGEEVNTSPTHAHGRYVINFGERSEEECRRRWPELMAIVETKVKPERLTKAKDVAGWPWWQFWRVRGELHAAITGLERLLVISRVGQQAAVTFLPAQMVYADSLIIFPFSTNSAFCALQARPHEIWARFFGSSMKDDLRYTPSDCFETFPFPEGWEAHPALEAAGKAYYDFRAALMIRNNEGLTKTYNRFHDPDERDPDILKLRELRAAMDRAVLNAYDWSNIDTACEFLLDYEIDEEEWGDKKKPWRYRWPDDVQAEVLARLLELNAERAQTEARAGASMERKKTGKRAAPKKRKAETGGLFS